MQTNITRHLTLCRVVLGACLALLLDASSAVAATITVNSTADPAGYNNQITIPQLGATVTLRDAVNAVRNTGGTHTITFAPTLAGQTIFLSQGQTNSGSALFPHQIGAAAVNLTIQGLTGDHNGITIARDPNSGSQGLVLCLGIGLTLTVNDLTFSGGEAGIGWGGAFNILDGATVSLNRCTLTGNRATLGGAIYSRESTLSVTNCTIAGNYAMQQGGGIYHYNVDGGFVTLTNTTITNNYASSTGGFFTYNGGDLLVNTIVAGNAVGLGPIDIRGNAPTMTMASASRNNLIGDPTAAGLGNGVNGNIVGANALLKPLNNNGGPTRTVALSPGSPALNAAAPNVTSTDQRGISRPQGAGADIGAYELVPGAPTTFTSAATTSFVVGFSKSFNVTCDGASPLTFSITGTLPAGISFDAAGQFSGTAAAGTEGNYPLTITATNSAGFTMQSFTLVVLPPIVVTTSTDEDNGSTNPALGTGTSLREAINYANGHAFPQIILFAPNLAGQSIDLTIPLDTVFGGPVALRIEKDITILGLTGNSGLTIRRAISGDLRIFWVYPGASLTLSSLTIADGLASFGAGIYSEGTLRMNRCTMRNNFARGGGGALVGAGELTNCTLVNNHSNLFGGAINNTSSSPLTLTNVTITGNTVARSSAQQGTGAGIYGNGSIIMINSIVAGNTDTAGPADLGSINFTASSHHNLIGNAVATTGLANGVNGNLVGVPVNQQLLGSLGNYGGPTQTIPILPGSPAIGSGATISGVTADQRGVPRDSQPDIGAFETMPPPIVLENPQSQVAPGGSTAVFSALANNLFSGSAASTLSNGGVLLPNQFLLSPNHAYQLLYQADGNLVLYRADGVALWGSGTAGQTPGQVVMQTDGNLVIYGAGGAPQFATGTAGNPNAVLVLQNDGNLVIYGSVPVFATHTAASGPPNAVPTVQWQVSTDGDATFNDIPGATGVTLSITVTQAVDDNRYRARFFSAGSGVVVPTAAATLRIQQPAAIPIIGPIGGTYQDSVQVSITSTSFNTVVRYTLDGSTPSQTNGQIYSGPFTLTPGNTAVKAIAYGGGWLDSPVANVTFTVLPPLPFWRNLHGLPADGSQDLATPAGDGIANLLKYAFNMAPNPGDLLVPNIAILPENGAAGLPFITRDAQGRLFIEFVRRKAATNPGVGYIVETGEDLSALQPLDLAMASVVSIDSIWERVSVVDPTVTPRRFGRLRVTAFGEYENDFGSGLADATLRGAASHTGGAVMLTDAVGGQIGSLVLNAIAATPAVNGFTARFQLAMGFTTSFPGDGASFAVGNLGTAPWGESGPGTPQSLTVSFDTYDNSGTAGIGIHVLVDGVHVATAPINPYTNGASVPVEISYDAGLGLTVRYDNALVFDRLAVPGFQCPANGKFGFGARTGGANHRTIVDTVDISLR
jgi:CSLREA domain-containing protein